LPEIIDKLRSQTSQSASKATVVIDARITTAENLALLASIGYNYLCVARSKPKNYELIEGQNTLNEPTAIRRCAQSNEN